MSPSGQSASVDPIADEKERQGRNTILASCLVTGRPGRRIEHRMRNPNGDVFVAMQL
jgi:hypothetical protein